MVNAPQDYKEMAVLFYFVVLLVGSSPTLGHMKVLKIENEGLTGYYLEEKFQDELDESGLVFISDETGETSDKIELHYKNEKDLESKLSYILMILTDR